MKFHIYLISTLLTIFWVSCQNNSETANEIVGPIYKVEVANARISLSTTDSLLAASFRWAATQAMAYTHDGNDPVGLWYEAALPKREAFCMRDLAHQSTGAHLLGLAEHNKNMLLKFAENISESKDWCTFWEINRFNQPAPVDYRNDKEFWYNLPANYDLLDACYRQYLWTGDLAYIQEPVFQKYYQRSMEDYTAKWQLGIDLISNRDRWINKPDPFDSSDYFHICRGLPSYEEGDPFKMQVGADLLGFQYKAYLAWANIFDLSDNKEQAEIQRQKASDIKEYFIKEWRNDSSQTFYQARFTDKGFVAKPSQFLLYTGIAHTAEHYQKEVDRLLNFGETNIESQSYLPLILFNYDQNNAGYDHILNLSAPEKVRREYPEVSFAVIEATVCGLAGVEADAANNQIITLPRITDHTQFLAFENVSVFEGAINISHLSASASVLQNNTGESISWKARFYGNHEYAIIDGEKQSLHHETTLGDKPVSFIKINVDNNEMVKVSILQ